MKKLAILFFMTLFLLSVSTAPIMAQLPDSADLKKQAEEAKKKADAAKREAEAKQRQLKAEKRAAEEKARKAAEEAARAKAALFQKVLYFNFNSIDVAVESQSVLDEILDGLDSIKQKIETAPSGTVLKLIGHADSVGDTDFNEQLSIMRAEAIKKLILDKGVIADSMISIEGKGEAEPAEAGNHTKNRRVVLTLGYEN